MTVAIPETGRTGRAPGRVTVWDDLVSALLYEARLFEELRGVLLEQRAGVARNDTEQIDRTIHTLGRVLLTLKESRDRRAALIAALTEGDAESLEQLESVSPEPFPGAVVDARTSVRQAGTAAARELAINQHIVQRALDAGDAFIQRLFSTVGGDAPGSPGGMMLNRTA